MQAASTIVSATAAGFRAAVTVDVTVTQPAISLFSVPGLVGAGLMSGTYTARLGASAHGGVTIRITSSNPALVLVSPNASTAGHGLGRHSGGQRQHRRDLLHSRGRGGARDGDADGDGQRLHAGAGQRDRRGARVAAGRRAGTTTTLSTSTAFYVYLGVLNAAGQFADYQPVRAGAASVTITVSNSTATVAQLVTLTGAGQTRR